MKRVQWKFQELQGCTVEKGQEVRSFEVSQVSAFLVKGFSRRVRDGTKAGYLKQQSDSCRVTMTGRLCKPPGVK